MIRATATLSPLLLLPLLEPRILTRLTTASAARTGTAPDQVLGWVDRRICLPLSVGFVRVTIHRSRSSDNVVGAGNHLTALSIDSQDRVDADDIVV